MIHGASGRESVVHRRTAGRAGRSMGVRGGIGGRLVATERMV